MRRRIPKRSIRLGPKGNVVVTLEDRFWDALKQRAIDTGVPLRDLAREIAADPDKHSFASAIRVDMLRYYQTLVLELQADSRRLSDMLQVPRHALAS